MLAVLVDQFLVVRLQVAAGLLVHLLALVALLQRHLVARLQEEVVGVVLVAMKAQEVAQAVQRLDTLAAGLVVPHLEQPTQQFQGADETFPICTRTSCSKHALLRVLLMFQMQPFTLDLAGVQRLISTTGFRKVRREVLAQAVVE